MRVTYIQPDGKRVDVEAKRGETVMSAAVAEGVEGIIADCRGGLTCATCHVFVDPQWMDSLGEPEGDEKEMLEMTVIDATASSRLSCQIVLSEDLDGLCVVLPEAQE